MPPFRRWFILVFSFFFVFRLVFTLNLLDAISLIPRLCFHPFVGMGTFCVCAHIIDDLFSFSFFFPPLNLISRRYYHYYYYIVARPLFLFAHISRFHDRFDWLNRVFCVCASARLFFWLLWRWRCHQLPLSLLTLFFWCVCVWDVTRIR